jgi:quinoprotein glucose dehydrogenase
LPNRFLASRRLVILAAAVPFIGGFAIAASKQIGASQADAPRPATRESYRGWASYGGTPDQIRYSSLAQINRSNVKRLEVAWTYDSGETGGLQTQPIVVDGILYGYTPTHKTFALRADTGEVLWIFNSGFKGQGANRGLMYWAESPAGGNKRVFAAVDQYLYALDAASGKPIESFGDKGRIDLRRDLGRPPESQSIRLTSPGVVYKDLLIIGGRVSEGLPATPGDVRAYSARTGELQWSFHTIPHPGEPGYETWSQNSWRENGGANSWPGMALDQVSGVVYVPTGSAAADFYGANRTGDNLYANSLIALNAETGKRIWHFQFVRHDIWDRDLPSPPSLVTVRQDGRTIDAVAQATKHGYLFVFDRATGKSLFPIEYHKFPTSDVPGETTADTQPIPTRPKPFARNLLTADVVTGGACEVSKRRDVRTVRDRQTDDHLSRIRWRRRMGRAGVRSRNGTVLRQCQRSAVDRRARTGRTGVDRTRTVRAELRRVPS